MAERLCRHYYEDYGLATYSVRFHNILGPLGTYEGGVRSLRRHLPQGRPGRRRR